jgi:hypothetical protein
MIMTASSICSSIRMKVLGQAEPLTVTDNPLDKASAIREDATEAVGEDDRGDSRDLASVGVAMASECSVG